MLYVHTNSSALVQSFQHRGLAKRRSGDICPFTSCVDRQSHAPRSICKDISWAGAGPATPWRYMELWFGVLSAKSVFFSTPPPLVSNSKHNVCTQRCLFTACCPHMWLNFNGMIHTSCRMRALCLHLSIKHWNERIFCSAFFFFNFHCGFSVYCYIMK